MYIYNLKKNALNKLAEIFTIPSEHRKAAYIMLAIIVLMIGINIILPYIVKPSKTIVYNNPISKIKKNSTNANNEENYNLNNYEESYKENSEIIIDINTATERDFNSISIPQFLAKRIIKARTNGFVFYKKEDIKKIYGFNENIYNRIQNQIEVKIEPQKNTNEKQTIKEETTIENNNSFKFQKININTADTTLLATLPMIGSKLALRIVNFRSKLRGYYSTEQLREVYGLSSETFEIIKNKIYTDGNIQKVNINSASIDKLNHPYLPQSIGKIILSYRQQHGPFEKKEDLLKIKIINQEQLEKINYYYNFDLLK